MDHREYIKKFNELKNKSAIKQCFYGGDACANKKIIKAHSIQENGVLNRISQDGKVIGVVISKEEFFTQIGIGKASTFSGFCGDHDQDIFKPIELYDYVIGNQEQEFLFAYRALAHQYYTDTNMLGVEQERQLNPDINLAGLNPNPNQKKMIEIYLEKRIQQLKSDIHDYEKNREAMNYFLDNKRFDRLNTHTIVFDEEYGIAVSASFAIYKDVMGNVVNDIYHSSGYLPSIFLTVFPQKGKTYVLISYLCKGKQRYDFIKAQIKDAPIEIQKLILSNIIIANVENFYLSPALYSKLEKKRDYLIKVYKSTAMLRPSLLFDEDLNIFL